MTTTHLSPSVTSYIDLTGTDDKTPAADLFTPDATVTDDGQTHTGREAIREWLSGTAKEYTYTSTLLSSEEADGVAIVMMLVEGNFPGGRVTLRYRFDLASDGLIRALAITA